MRFWRSMVVVVGCGATAGCGGVTVHEVSPASPNSLPAITIARIQGCTAEFGKQLEPGSYNFNPIVEVDRDGYKRGVEMSGVPDTAPDLAACMRIALNDMAIPASVFNMRSTQSASTDEPTKEQRTLLGNPAVVVAVVVVVEVGEIVLEAGAITILFATTVKVVDNAKDDVMDLAKRWRPKPNKNRCLDAAAGGTYMWRAFCDSLANDVDREACWARDLESEQNKRGWCNWKFGN